MNITLQLATLKNDKDNGINCMYMEKHYKYLL